MHGLRRMTEVPVRTRLTILRDGSANPLPLAFCAAEGRSVPLVRCATCGFGARFSRDGEGRFVALECRRIVPARSGADESGDRPTFDGSRASGVDSVPRATPVGVALTRPFVCFAADAPLGAVARYFDGASAALGFPVVDDHGRLVGTLGRATATLAIASARRPERLVGAMVVPSRVVDERASVGMTLASMRERWAQEVMVLGDDRALVGVLRDIDVLRLEAGSESRISLAG